MPDDLKAIIDKAIAAGYSDDDIRAVAKAHASAASESDARGQSEPSMVSAAAGAVKDAAIGAGKGFLKTVGGLGQMVRMVPGVSELDRVMTPIPVNVTPDNAAQKVGMAAEQIGEFFVPVMGTGGKLAQAAKAGFLTMAQTGSPGAAVASAGITAAMPGVAGAVARAAGPLRKSAEKSVAQALGATKEWAKADAAKLAPQMLARGVRGTRDAMLSQARAMASQVGQQLDEAYTAAAAAGETVSGAAIREQLANAAGSLAVTDARGVATLIPGTERVARQLSKLDEFVASLGDDIPVDKAAAVKRTWDRVVSKAGLYGPKAVSSATDSADAWALREGAGAFRALLNKNPTLADLNAESAFWTGLKKVLVETEKRTQPQRGGLTDVIRGTGGAVIGAAAGGPVGAGAGQFLSQKLSTAVNSPWWKTTAAGPAKQALAEALASGQPGRVRAAMATIARALPSQAVQP